MIVADTNLVAYLLIDGPRTGAARRVREKDPDWLLPPLWRSEMLNVLATCVRAGVLDEGAALSAWLAAISVFGRCELEPRGEAVLKAAIGRRISAYDAQFVVLAEMSGVRLVTGDNGIVKSCKDVAVSIEEFTRSD